MFFFLRCVGIHFQAPPVQGVCRQRRITPDSMCNDCIVRRHDAQVLVLIRWMNQFGDGQYDGTVHLADVSAHVVC